jgi:hypothetical protein
MHRNMSESDEFSDKSREQIRNILKMISDRRGEILSPVPHSPNAPTLPEGFSIAEPQNKGMFYSFKQCITKCFSCCSGRNRIRPA